MVAALWGVCLLAVSVRTMGEQQSPPSENPAELWLAHLRHCLERVHSVRAQFEQESISSSLEPQSSATGTIEVRRKRRFRLQYRSGIQGLLVSNGHVLWSYHPPSNIAVKSRTRDSLLPDLFDFIAGQSTRQPPDAPFTTRFLGGAPRPGEGPASIALIPSTPDPFVQKIVLGLKGGCPSLGRVLIVDHAGIVNRFTLSQIEINPKIGNRRFTFTPPRKTQIVRP